MSIARERFELALQRLTYPEWSRFETLCSTFLASEYGTLRTMATPSGDSGRDSQLYRADGELDVAFQYSVTDEWEKKIKHTVRRLKAEFGSINNLVYMSSRLIGAKADRLKKELRTQGVSLDIRDASWFLERANLDNNRSAAAESLATAMVDPLLVGRGVIANSAVSLSGDEAKTALIYLEMHREDEVRGKNLTRSSFESLVKAALRGTDRDNRLAAEDLYRRVGAFLPRHGAAQLKPFIDGAITRLKRDAVSEWGGGREYHLRHDEAERIKDRAAKLFMLRSAFDVDLMDVMSSSLSNKIEITDNLKSSVHAVVEKYFLERGAEFAQSVNGDADIELHYGDLRTIITKIVPPRTVDVKNQTEFMFNAILALLTTPSESTRKYLRVLSDSYTLFSFLSETPDVQRATNKLFSQGEIWVDASVLLPIIAETSAPSDLRPFTSLFQQLKRASAKLYVTPGIIEEVRSHLDICLNRARSSQWTGKVPYVYAKYVLNGGKPNVFASWLENFVGNYDPSRDLVEYFEKVGICLQEPANDSEVPEDVRFAVSNYWQEVQSRRRGEQGVFSVSAQKLARHDSENCLTVISDRLSSRNKTGLGHSSWWFTLDTAAYNMKTALPREIWEQIKYSPVISLDYLMKYLAFGPARDKISLNETSASHVFAPALLDSVPNEFIEIAEKVRVQHQGLPENLVQRRIRDTLDRQREKIGALHQAGLDGFDPTLLV